MALAGRGAFRVYLDIKPLRSAPKPRLPQFADMLVEVDAKTRFSQALLGRMAKDIGELKAVYGALYAHGTENNAKGVCAMIPGLQVSQITMAMRAECRCREVSSVIESEDALSPWPQSIAIGMLC